MSVVFGDAESLHRHLLKFATQSGKQVHINGEEYTVHHTQFGTYDIREALSTVIEGTNTDPRYDEEFKQDAREVISGSTATLDMDLQSHYERREYIDAQDLWSAAADYRQHHMSDESDDIPDLQCMTPRASSREEAIAEVFSLMHAETAETDAILPFTSAFGGDDEDEEVPNEGVDTDEAVFSLRDTVLHLHGPSALKRPDPSLHTTRVIYELYDEFGMRRDVRSIYGLFVTPTRPGHYKPTDSEYRHIKQQAEGLLRRGNRDEIDKWTSNTEPPLETLDSYDEKPRYDL